MTLLGAAPSIEDFITRWSASAGAERANFQGFAKELCALIGVEQPRPSVLEAELNPYVLVKPGQTYSQRVITQSADLIRLRLGEEGYAFATVEPVPDSNNNFAKFVQLKTENVALKVCTMLCYSLLDTSVSSEIFINETPFI